MNDHDTILAVDDSRESLALLVGVLTEAGYQVRSADSGELALAAVAAKPPDLILLDVRMPGVDGLEVCRRLKAGEETRQIPIILMSAFADVTDWVAGLQLGAADYIAKPFRTEELLSRVVTHLSLRRARVSYELQAAALGRANDRLQCEQLERHRIENELRQTLDRAERSRRAMLSTLEDQARVAAALSETEERLRVILHSTADGILAVDTSRKTIFSNSRFAELWRIPQSLIDSGDDRAMLGFMRAQLVEPDAFLSKVEQLYTSTGPDSASVRFKDGRCFEWSSMPMVDRGVIIGRLWTFHDATERTQAETALRKSESDYRYLFDATNDGILIFEPEHEVILEANAAACASYGFTHVELVGMNLKTLTHDVRRGEAQVEEVLAEGVCRDFESVHVNKAGKPICFLINSSVIDYRGQKAILSINRDITQRKQAERSLHLHSAALNAAANAIIITDASGAIEWINGAFTRLTGYSPEEAIGKNPRELVKSGVHNRAFYEEVWTSIFAGKVWQGVMTNRRKNGELYVEEQTITPVKDDRGQIAHFIAIKRDLTEQRLLEAQFLQSQKMETVGQLAGGIAHDFNNLLTIINGTAELAVLDLPEDDPLRADFGEIRQAGDRAAALTRQLLAFSRKQVMRPEVVNLGSLVAGTQGMLQRLIGEHVDLVVTPGKPLGSVLVDPSQIEQVIMNLAVNARDAMPDGGTLVIEASDVVLDAAYAAEHPSVHPGPHVMLAINDTGVGMDAATQKRIFEPFFTTKEQGKGTGLGLSTVYGIVKQSGGSIWVYSEPGRGTAFKVYFPRVESVAFPRLAAPTATPAHGAETILIVEDEAAVCYLAERVLRTAGYTVLTARNGAESLAVLERHDGPVDLVLTDMVMPGMSGRDLSARIAEIRPRMKMLYTSGYTDDVILRDVLLDNTARFIAKPYAAIELTRKVREVLDAPI